MSKGHPDTMPVLESAQFIVQHAQDVKIDDAALDRAAEELVGDLAAVRENAAHGWDRELHFYDGGPHTLQYLLVLDTLNFCFWPDGELEYEHLAGGLKAAMLEDITCLDADKLAHIDGPALRALLRWPRDLPLQEERARLLRELGAGLLRHFGGRAAALVGAARGSAMALVELLAAHFPGFRDHAVYKGRQVFFLKRAQIFAADVFGAFGGRGLGAFTDAARLTCFADYRVPVVLRAMGVLAYSDRLAAMVDSREELPAGGQEEAEVRGATVLAVERLRARVGELLRAKQRRRPREGEVAEAAEAQEGAGGRAGGGGGDAAAAAAAGGGEGAGAPAGEEGAAGAAGGGGGGAEERASAGKPPPASGGGGVAEEEGEVDGEPLLSIHLDWWLWARGERARGTDPPHHRTLTIYY